MHDNKEIKQRIEVLFKEHGVWLIQAATNITKNREEAEDLVGDLYIYLLEKGTPKIYYKASINALYCYRFLQTRWVNKVVKRDKIRISADVYEMKWEPIDEVYSSEQDEEIMNSFDSVQEELQRLQKRYRSLFSCETKSPGVLWPQVEQFLIVGSVIAFG